jgi:CubicO group peptidase (beta-lactamase class C family)
MSKRTTLITALLCLSLTPAACPQGIDAAKKLDGFDDYMAKVLKDWNGPGIGVGIVVGDKLVFAKGYGYRDYENLEQFAPSRPIPNCLPPSLPVCWWKKAN